MSVFSSARCPICQSNSVRLTTPAGPAAQSFRCNDCGSAWSVTYVRDPATTISEGSTEVVPPPCIRCGSPARAIVDETSGALRFECGECGTLFTPPDGTR